MQVSYSMDKEIEELEFKYFGFNWPLLLQNLLEGSFKAACIYFAGDRNDFKNAVLPLYKLGVRN